MSENNFIKNITSKDLNLSKNTIKNLIYSVNIEQFSELCEKADFIFPFLKERIIKDFLNFVKNENLYTIFEFSKIYSYDFEDLIVLSWVKFACEDLTDEILELFENGSDEQKAYCAKYFSHVKDTLSLELLRKYAYSDYEPLRNNCAIALSGFGDVSIIDEMKNVIDNSDDEFKQLSAFQFLISYNSEKLIEYIFDASLNNPFCANIISLLKNNYSFQTLKKELSFEKLQTFFAILIDNYPENITLDTIIQFEIFEFIQYFKKENYNQFSENILLIAKNKFSEYLNNDIYSFDLDKDTKIELKNIVDTLSEVEFKLQDFESQMNSYLNNEIKFEFLINVIKEFKLESYCSDLANLINQEKLNNVLLTKCAFVLKELNKLELINKELIENIQDENIKALVLSLF